jgi:hypothetical protein
MRLHLTRVPLLSSSSIFELTAHHEDRDIWKHFLSVGQYVSIQFTFCVGMTFMFWFCSPASRYDVALSHATSPEHRMTILRAQADHYYSLKKFELAASL